MIEFIEEGHLYLQEGILVPSVSEILRFIFPDKYKGIPGYILKNAATFGTNIHKAIELFETDPLAEINFTDIKETLCFEQYLKVKKKFNINPVKQEEIIHYKHHYAGTYDMLADVNYHRCLVDIKTTAKMDIESLEWQLGMYKLALEESGTKIAKCYCLWLPKGNLGELREITPKSKNQIMKVIQEYENQKGQEN